MAAAWLGQYSLRVARPDSSSALPPSEAYDFSLQVGGPLYRLLKRLGLVDEGMHRLGPRVALAVVLTWVPLVALSAMERSFAPHPPSMRLLGDIGCHVRFLAAAPLLLLAEVIVHRQMQPLIDQFRVRGLVRPDKVDRLLAAIGDAHRWRNSLLAELVLLAAVYVVSFVSVQHRYAATYPDSWYVRPGGHSLSLAGLWFVFVSLPVFQFLLFRWYFRLLIWGIFLFRVARLPLQVEPLHPDRAGGLGFLGHSLYAFVPIAAAHGFLLSGYLADRIFYAGAMLTDFKFAIGAELAVLLAIFVGPLLLFLPVLLRAKRSGLWDYGRVAQGYVRAFDVKWIQGPQPAEEPILGTGDIQSLADLGNSFAVVEQMHLFPLSRTALLQFTLAFLLPLAPLVLTVVPAEQIGSTLVQLIL
jgi:hypothetical protein